MSRIVVHHPKCSRLQIECLNLKNIAGCALVSITSLHGGQDLVFHEQVSGMTVSNSAQVWLTGREWCSRLGRSSLANTSCLKPSSVKCYWLILTLAGHGSRSERFSSRQERGRLYTFHLSPYEQDCRIWLSIAIDLTLLSPARIYAILFSHTWSGLSHHSAFSFWPTKNTYFSLKLYQTQ